MLVNRNKEYRLKRKNQRKDYIIQDKNFTIKTLYCRNETKRNKIEQLEQENQQLKEKVGELTQSLNEQMKETNKENLDCSKYAIENQQLKEKINTYENPEDLTLMFMYCDEKAKDKVKDLNEKVDYLKNKCENKDKWCQLIADIGYDYDGYRQADSLMKLIDELVKYAIWSRDNYDYDAFQEEGNNE